MAAVLFLLFYFIPSFIAMFRGHPQDSPIFIVNLTLGWTVIGWIAALAWSVSHIDRSPKTIVQVVGPPNDRAPPPPRRIRITLADSDDARSVVRTLEAGDPLSLKGSGDEVSVSAADHVIGTLSYPDAATCWDAKRQGLIVRASYIKKDGAQAIIAQILVSTR
jgi:hypothetical protein